MRLLHWPEFAQMPEGTIFTESEDRDCNFGQLMMKDETVYVDGFPRGYWSTDLCDIDGGEDSNEHF